MPIVRPRNPGTLRTGPRNRLAVARQASVLYCVQNGNACDYAAGRPTYRPGSRERMVKVDAAYLKAHRAAVAEQLKRGGVRLAALLNRAFAQ